METIKNQTTAKAENRTEYKLFLKRDVFVYTGLALFIFCLFLIFVFPQSCNLSSSSKGFTVTIKSQTVLVIDFNKSEHVSISENFFHLVEVTENGNRITVKVFTDENKSNYNIILFDSSEFSAKVVESTCSESKDCVYFPTLTSSGSIYCAPHQLKIQPIGGGGFLPPIAG